MGCSTAHAAGAADGTHLLLLLLLRLLQVTTFSLFRLIREVDGDLTEDQLSTYTYTSPATAASALANSSSSSSSSVGSDSEELLLLQYVRNGAFGKLCEVMASVQDGSAHELAFSMLLSLALVPEAQRLVADRNEVACIVKVSPYHHSLVQCLRLCAARLLEYAGALVVH
jgi:hypothetical protein